MAKGMKKGYIVLRDELAPGEDFEASVKPMFKNVDSEMDQVAMPDPVAKNPDGPDIENVTGRPHHDAFAPRAK